jgi:hypothetical protein
MTDEKIQLGKLMPQGENTLMTNEHVLLCLDVQVHGLELIKEFEYVRDNFCGVVMDSMAAFAKYDLDPTTITYLCGDLNLFEAVHDLPCAVYVIAEFSRNFSEGDEYVPLGAIPINVHHVGVYFRGFFDADVCSADPPAQGYFEAISSAHEFQNLGESNKPGIAYRKGIYLTPVEETPEGLKFNLLRCSSNLHGPTCNFAEIDTRVVSAVNDAARSFFTEEVNLNHVLAQIYVNQRNENGKERKSKIKEHSDKTKDMPANAIMAFCTFYKDYNNGAFTGELAHIKKKPFSFDYMHKSVSMLTRLRFRLKDDIPIKYTILVKTFDVVLYPNSVFMMSLMSNRWYTHEIIPSPLPIDKLPMRMGYVIRCSNTEAIHRDGQTYVVDQCEKKLEKMSSEDMKLLRQLYAKENATSERVTYPNTYFSMNQGDYVAPLL